MGVKTMKKSDDTRLSEAHARIAAMPEERRRDAMIRLSRSFSAPRSCVQNDGCRRDGDDIVWPDGERWPTRTEELRARVLSTAEIFAPMSPAQNALADADEVHHDATDEWPAALEAVARHRDEKRS